MKNSIFAGLALLIINLCSPLLLAQGDARKASIRVTLNGSSSGYNYRIFTNDAKNTELTLATNNAQLIQQDIQVKPGVTYTVGSVYSGTPPPEGTDQPMGSASYTINIVAPTGYKVFVAKNSGDLPATETIQINGLASTMYPTNGSVYNYRFQVIEDAAVGAAMAGKLTRLDVGDLVFELGLGTLKNGKSAGRLQMRNEGKIGANHGLPTGNYEVFDIYGLNLVAPEAAATGIDWTMAGAKRRLETGQVRVDVESTGINKYTISFFAGDDAGGYNGSAYATYTLEKITASSPYTGYDCLKITEAQGSVSIVRYVYRSTSVDTWVLVEGIGGEQRTEEHTNATVSGKREETVTIKNSNGTVVAKSRRTWAPYSVSELLTKVEVWTDANSGSPGLTTSYEYYTGGGVGDGDQGKLKKITYPNGGATEYDYYDDSGRLGRVQTVTEPWSTGTATVTKVTTYDYTGPIGAPKDYLLSEETTIGGTTVTKTINSYDFTTSSTDTMDLAVQTSTHYAASGVTLTSITSSYSKHVDYSFADQPYMIKLPDGRQQSFRYQKGSYSGGTFTPGTGSTDTAFRIYIVEGSHLGGTATTNIAGLTFAEIGLVENQSTLTEVIRDREDNVVSEKISVWNGSAFDTAKPIVSTTTTWADGVRQTGRIELNGTQQNWTWNGAYLASEKDAAGIEHTYGYDSVGRLSTMTRTSLGSYDGYQAFDAVTTTYGYDAANRKTSETQAGGSLTRTATYGYDAAGRPTSVVLPDGRSSTTSYSFPGNNITQIAENLPGGEIRTTQTLVDGKTKQVLYTYDGVDIYYSYSVDGYGRITARTDYASGTSSRWEKNTTDWLGRPVESVHSGLTGQGDIVEANTYEMSTGLLTKVARTGFADEYRSYDNMGSLIRTGIDLGANGSLADTDTADRVRDYETIFDKVGSDWWVRTTEKTYPSISSPSAALITTKNWTRLTGFGSGVITDTGLEDRFGNRTNIVTTLDRTKRRITQSTAYPGVSNSAVSIVNNGLPVKMIGTDLRSITQTYDGLGRLYQQQDSRLSNPTTYTYIANGSYATHQVATITDPASAVVATYTYDSAGRIASAKNAGNHYAYYSYDKAGRVVRQWGGAVTPVEYVYNTYGEVTEQKTFRGGTWTGTSWPGGSADTTTFTYDSPSGLLTRKLDAAGNHVDYTYNDRGLVATREWKRLNGSSQRVKTTYGYATKSTELISKTYNDGTPDVSFTYNRLGQMLTAVDVSDGSSTGTRTFEYDNYMRLTTEKLPSYLGSRWISYTFENGSGGTVIGRTSGYTLGVSGSPAQDLTNLISYSDVTGNVSKVTATHVGVSAREFVYSYKSNSSLLGGVSESSTGYNVTRNYEANRDLLVELTTKFATATKARYDYTYNSLGQRISAKQSGQSGTAFSDLGNTFYRYTYNSRGEITEAVGYMGADVDSLTIPLSGRTFQFGYDQAGNRASANSTGLNDLKADYTGNSLNQVVDRENNYVTVSGTIDYGSRVLVNGGLAGVQGNYWSGEAILNNVSGPVYANAAGGTGIPVKAASGTGSNTIKQTLSPAVSVYQPAALETFTYDLDGNLTQDGKWNYVWDAENRLVKMETHSVAMGVGLPGKRLIFRYDSLGRRTVKEAWSYSASVWSKTGETRFIYQGWNLVAELNSAGTRQRTYAWGLDLAGSMNGMGGIGALLQMVDHTGTVASYLPGYDGSGNVAAMVKSTGVTSASYEYGAFGEPLRRDGVYASTNPFRSATKYTDDESGLVYYGMRYYSPSLGRFINRDPIGEAGGINTYGFAGNNPITGYDYLGLDANGIVIGIPQKDGSYWAEWIEIGPSGDDLRDAWIVQANKIASMIGVAPKGSTWAESESNWEKHYAKIYGWAYPGTASPSDNKGSSAGEGAGGAGASAGSNKKGVNAGSNKRVASVTVGPIISGSTGDTYGTQSITWYDDGTSATVDAPDMGYGRPDDLFRADDPYTAGLIGNSLSGNLTGNWNALDLAGRLIGYGGIAAGVKEYTRYMQGQAGRPGIWRGKNGKFYPTTWGGNGATGGKLSFAKAASANAHLAGSLLNWAGLAVSVAQLGQAAAAGDTNRMVQSGADAIAGAIGFWGPIGWAFSTSYFVTREVDNFFGVTDALAQWITDYP